MCTKELSLILISNNTAIFGPTLTHPIGISEP